MLLEKRRREGGRERVSAPVSEKVGGHLRDRPVSEGAVA